MHAGDQSLATQILLEDLIGSIPKDLLLSHNSADKSVEIGLSDFVLKNKAGAAALKPEASFWWQTSKQLV